MLQFKERLIKRQPRFEAEVIPGMYAYAAATRGRWTREQVKYYEIFENLLSMLSICFKWADLPSPELIIEHIAMLLTTTALGHGR